jgi:hypothetical protein
MKRMWLVVPMVVLALVGSYAPPASGADQKTVRGTITAVTADSVSITAGTQPMKFAVDKGTNVEAAGAGTKSRAAQAAGKPGAKLTDLVRTGESIEVSYDESNGVLHAAKIRRISTMTAVDPAAVNEARGKVTAISAASLTIAGSSGGATFTQTYAIDPNTHIIGKGVGTTMASKGGRASVTDVVSVGDSVSVSYRAGADALRATEIRVVAGR